MLDNTSSHKFVLDEHFKLVPQSAAVPSPLSTRYVHVVALSGLFFLLAMFLEMGRILTILPAFCIWLLGTLFAWVIVKLRKPRGVKLVASLNEYLEKNKPRFEKELHDSAFTLNYHFFYNSGWKRADGLVQFVAVEDMIQAGGNQLTEDSMADDSIDHGTYVPNAPMSGGGFRNTHKSDF